MVILESVIHRHDRLAACLTVSEEAASGRDGVIHVRRSPAPPRSCVVATFQLLQLLVRDAADDPVSPDVVHHARRRRLRRRRRPQVMSPADVERSRTTDGRHQVAPAAQLRRACHQLTTSSRPVPVPADRLLHRRL